MVAALLHEAVEKASQRATGRPTPNARGQEQQTDFQSAQPCPALTRPQKITLGEMRAAGVRGLLICCSDYKCSHWVAISGDRWPDDARLSDIEPKFTCQACGLRGADVRPNFHWEADARGAKLAAATKHGVPSP